MTTAARPVGPRLLVWIVGLSSTVEALLQAASALAHRDRADLIIWSTGALVIFAAASFVERVKTWRSE